MFLIFGHTKSSLQRSGFLQLHQVGAALLVVHELLIVVCGLLSVGSRVVVHGLSCPMACRIFPDQGSNLCPLHWQEES